jgi:3-polyprenyl-4-hydroxybenzoate decarboxylase
MASLSGPCLHPKLAIAVDDDIDPNDLRQVMWSMTTRVHAEKDVTMIHNTRTFALDKTSPVREGGHQFERVGTKWLIDATKPAITHPEERAQFAPAMPINLHSVNLEDFLPEEVFK